MKKTSQNNIDILKKHGVVEKDGKYECGEWLDLRDTGISALPEGLTVGGWLYLRGTGVTDTSMVKHMDDNAIVEWSTGHAKIDGIFGKTIRKRGDVWKMQYISGDVFYIVSNGEKHAHGKTVRDAANDLAFKCADRDIEQYRGMTGDSVLSFFDAQVCYRNVTGACLEGIRQFLKNKIAEPKEEYTIAEIIELTKGQYRSGVFAAFFNGAQ